MSYPNKEDLIDFGNEIYDLQYIIEKVVHIISKNGKLTETEAKRIKNYMKCIVGMAIEAEKLFDLDVSLIEHGE